MFYKSVIHSFIFKTTFNDVVERPNDRISYLQLNAVKISKKYICNAKNYVGESTSAIDVIVDEPFNVISAPPGDFLYLT